MRAERAPVVLGIFTTAGFLATRQFWMQLRESATRKLVNRGGDDPTHTTKANDTRMQDCELQGSENSHSVQVNRLPYTPP